MNRKEAKDAFEIIKQEYDQVPYPKYVNANMDDLQQKYDQLREMEEYLQDDLVYAKLINSISQTISRLSRKGTWINASERGMNKAMHPVIKKGTQEVSPYEWEDKSGQKCSISGYWDARNYMVMDVVGYLFLLKEGGDQLPDSITPLFNDVGSIRKREQELKNNQQISPSNTPMVISDADLSAITNQKYYVKFDDHYFRKFTGLNICSNDILALLLETSRVEFRVTFPVRMLKDKGRKMEEKWYSMNVFSRPFEVGYINQDERKDGIVQNRVYYIIFNTILGEMFVHNLSTKNYDWVSNNLYHLPQSSQIFYRQFLLHHDYTQIQLNLGTIKERMDFRDANITNLIANLEINTLTPLMRNGLILSYEKTAGISDIKYIIHLPKKGGHHDGKSDLQQQTQATCISEGDVGFGK